MVRISLAEYPTPTLFLQTVSLQGPSTLTAVAATKTARLPDAAYDAEIKKSKVMTSPLT
jgi:hypothetical protein